MSAPVYLDWNATAPLLPEARAAWLAAQDASWANPGSVHAYGQQARHTIDQAKITIARLLGGAAHEWVVTSGGSESNALAIASAMSTAGTIVCGATEHSSILRNAESHAPVQKIPVDGAGRIDASALGAALGAETRLVCMQFANNELGVRQDIPTLSAIVRAAAPQAWFHVDAAQGVGKTAVDVRKLGVDSVAVAGHKCGSPKGVGLLWVRSGKSIEALVRGGRQQQDRRSGTEDAALIASLAAALEIRCAAMSAEATRQSALLTETFATIRQHCPQAKWNGQAALRLANVLNLSHPGVLAEAMVTRLDLAGFAVSRGSACMSAGTAPTHVIAALGMPDDLARSAIRVSIGWTTTATELAAFAAAYAKCVLA